jgi:hypothetical protein
MDLKAHRDPKEKKGKLVERVGKVKMEKMGVAVDPARMGKPRLQYFQLRCWRVLEVKLFRASIRAPFSLTHLGTIMICPIALTQAGLV